MARLLKFILVKIVEFISYEKTEERYWFEMFIGLYIGTLLGIIVLNILLWIFAMPVYVNHKLSNFQNELVNRHYDEVDTMYRQMRGWRHDYHNHIQVLKAYMSLAQYDEAVKYLDKLEEDLSNVDTVLRTGNVMVDAILNSKLTLLREKNIAVNVTAIVPEDIPISGIDLSILIGNMLDNAMEACMQIPDEKERFIRIYIDIIKKQFYICITNSMTEKTKKKGGELFLSDKGGNHGFGLLRIDSIVSKYNGYIKRQAEADVFATEIMLPLI